VTDNNFSSIVAGIGEVLLFMIGLLAGLPLPLLAVRLLWLNPVTNGIQGAALAFEAGEPEAMQRPPRKPGEGIFNEQMVTQTAISGITMAAIASLTWSGCSWVAGMRRTKPSRPAHGDP